MQPEYQDRDLRLQSMDEQGVEATFMFNNNAILAQSLLPEVDVLFATLRSFNRWQEEEWGYAYQGRIFCPAMLSLEDLDLAVELLDEVIRNGARAIALVPGPAAGRSPSDPFFDPFWSRVDEAGLLVGYHICEAGYTARRSPEWGLDPHPTFYTQSAFQWMFMYGDQPIQETLAQLIFDNFFGRFPNIKVVTAEYGIEWAPLFCRKLDKYRGMGRNGPWVGGQLAERPSEIFKQHVRMHPFWEDDIVTVVEALGPDVIIGGSDFPHPEGLADPVQLAEHLDGLDTATQRAIMRDNGMALIGR
jgi:predicted TIM-barrel fold metal-dependent hydrolase